VLVNRNGKQFQKLTDLFSVLVFEAIGLKLSLHVLLPNEQKWISEDQKHSSNVARVHYQKKRSREVAMRGRQCMQKLLDRSNSSQIEYEKQQQSSSEQEHCVPRQIYQNGVQVFALHLKKTIVYNWALENLVYVGQRYYVIRNIILMHVVFQIL
jgi:hypothetical protein